MNKYLLFFLFIMPTIVVSQKIITGKVLDMATAKPLPYATVRALGSEANTLTNIDGSFQLKTNQKDKAFKVSYIGFNSQTIQLNGQKNFTIFLKPRVEDLEKITITSTEQAANKIIRKVIAHKPVNDIDQKYTNYTYNAYTKLIIDNERNLAEVTTDTANAEVKTILTKGRSYLSEQHSNYIYTQKNGLKEVIEATHTAGFNEPVYELLSIKVQSNSWYKEKYTIFGTDYVGVLMKRSFNTYSYKILDTTKTKRPAYVIYFQPKQKKAVASLEGVVYIDTLNYGVQKAIGQLKGELDVQAVQDYSFSKKENCWIPTESRLTLKPGTGGKKVSIFGGSISFGSLEEEAPKNDSTYHGLFLQSITKAGNFKFNTTDSLPHYKSSITLLKDATEKPDEYWNTHRAIPFTERDEATFARVDSIIKKNNISRKISIIQHFNNGYFPLGFVNLDLRTLIKYNNYEGLRLGAGGITNENFSTRFRVQGYGAYGFIDDKYKYGAGLGLALSRKTGTWLNVNYVNDIAEVGSFVYLTDLLEYSLFEPRLVNINFYYKYQTEKISLEHRFLPELISQWQLAVSNIQQTDNYRFLKNNKTYGNYELTEATMSLKWSPFSKFLKSDDKTIEIDRGYPKFTLQVTKAFDGFLEGDFDYTKIGAKINYTLNRITQNNTQFILEGDYAMGNLPLTHAFHAYPNNPQKEKISGRFSVAGRNSFETMYFNEFFSDRLATLQVRHRFRPFDLGKKFKPEIVLISRYAIGNMTDKYRHLGVNFKTLDQGYTESGIEINKIFLGFGLSFTYRYGAYHLPELEDNMALKFTFYLKL